MSFHVPESARLGIDDHPLLGSTSEYGNNGVFRIDSPEPAWELWMICSDGTDPDVPQANGWEHVSVHAHRKGQLRTPTWKEMVFVKDLYWDAEDVVVQFHPRKSEYVNRHPHVLHLWRFTGAEFLTPPKELVG